MKLYNLFFFFFFNGRPSSSACRWWNTSRCCCKGRSEHIREHLFSTGIPNKQLAAIWRSLLQQSTPEELALCTAALTNVKAMLGTAFYGAGRPRITHNQTKSFASSSQPSTSKTFSLLSTIIINNNILGLSETAGKGRLRYLLKETSTQLAASSSGEHQRAQGGGGGQNHV